MVSGGRRVVGRASWASGLRAAVVALVAVALGSLLMSAEAWATYLPVGERYAPHGIAIDLSTGSIYSGDADGTGLVCRVLSVDSTGIPKVVAGVGRCGATGDGGPATDAAIETPAELAIVGRDGDDRHV